MYNGYKAVLAFQWKGLMQVHKRLISAIAVLLLLMQTIAYAASGIVNADVLNVRENPSTSATILGKLYSGDVVHIISEENDWLKIEHNGSEAYVYGAYVSERREGEVTSRSDVRRTVGGAIAEYAKQFIGVPYSSGGSTPLGFDCSGLTSYVYRQFGYSLNRTSSGQALQGSYVSKDALQPGDLLFFSYYGGGRISHVGIYAGNGNMIHATVPGSTVKMASLDSSYYLNNYITARRIAD